MLGKRTRRCEFLADIHSAKLMQTPYLLISTLKNLIVCGQSDELSQDEKRRRKEIIQVYEERSLFNNFKDSFEEILRIFDRITYADTHPSTEDRILNLEAYASKSMWWYVPNPPQIPKKNVLNSDSIKFNSNALWKRIFLWRNTLLIVSLLYLFYSALISHSKCQNDRNWLFEILYTNGYFKI